MLFHDHHFNFGQSSQVHISSALLWLNGLSKALSLSRVCILLFVYCSILTLRSLIICVTCQFSVAVSFRLRPKKYLVRFKKTWFGIQLDPFTALNMFLKVQLLPCEYSASLFPRVAKLWCYKNVIGQYK